MFVLKEMFLRTFIYTALFYLISSIPVWANGNDSLFTRLDKAIAGKEDFVRQKQKRIAEYRRMLSTNARPDDKFEVNDNLYQEYRKFKIDSAIYYVEENIAIAEKLKNKEKETASLVKLANLYSSTGRYREAEGILKSIKSASLPGSVKALYYEFYSQFYEHYATNSYSEHYVTQIEAYRDSLLGVLDRNTAKYHINRAQRNIYLKNFDTAQKDLLHLMRTAKSKDGDYAMYVYLLGDIYGLQKQHDKMLEFYIRAAVADIENAIKDNAAIQNIAIICYEDKEIDKAYKYTQSALEDAIFCNVKFRTLMMSEFYSIINTAYLEKESESKSQLMIYFVLVCILTIFLITAVIYVYRQMKKVSRIKEQLSANAEELATLNKEILSANSQLKDINDDLFESNLVKEEYIARFFDICSAYINKMEGYRKMLYRKMQDKKYEDLMKTLRSTSVTDDELEELYQNFDTIFISLYPTFVEDFNALLNPDEQVLPKPGEILNTELRIFALIRLGINDSAKIAAFLRYSLSTIYNYRTKARNKAAVSRDTFENLVARIGIIQEKQ